MPRFLTHRHCETINVYYFKLPNLGGYLLFSSRKQVQCFSFREKGILVYGIRSFRKKVPILKHVVTDHTNIIKPVSVALSHSSKSTQRDKVLALREETHPCWPMDQRRASRQGNGIRRLHNNYSLLSAAEPDELSFMEHSNNEEAEGKSDFHTSLHVKANNQRRK